MRGGVIVVALLALAGLLPAAAAAQGRGAREIRPFYDSRAGEPAPPPALLKLDGALTGPRAGGREGIARSYLRTKRFGSSDLALAKRIDAPRGVTILRYRQEYRGIPAFDGGVSVALDRAGRVLGATGSPQPDLAVPSITPKLSAAQARRSLARSVGAARATGDEARRTLFGGRLAWRVDVEAGPGEHYDGVVDADQRAAAVARQPRQERLRARVRLLPGSAAGRRDRPPPGPHRLAPGERDEAQRPVFARVVGRRRRQRR